MSTSLDLADLLRIFLILAGAAILLAGVLIGWIVWRIRRIRLPQNADFITALQHTPLVVVVVLDLLDFGLDFLSVPIGWALLSRLGLQPLRGATILEELIPGTQLVPTMTIAWALARLVGRRRIFHG